MEKNSEVQVDRWVDERLATLGPDNGWQPDAASGFDRLRQRRGPRNARGRTWIWAAAAATAAGLGVMALPAPRALAQRCLNCSVAQLQSLSASAPVRAGVLEIPWLMEFQQAYGGRDFVVPGVSLDEDGWESVRPFMEGKKINYRVMIGSSEVAGLYGGVEVLPTTVIIDRSGRIASTHVGLVSKNDCQTGIEMLLSKK